MVFLKRYSVLVVGGLGLFGVAGAQSHWTGDGPWQIKGTLVPGEMHWYRIPVQGWHQGVTFDFGALGTQAVAVYARRGAPPTKDAYDYSTTLSSGGALGNRASLSRPVSLKFPNEQSGKLESGDWYFAFDSKSSLNWTLQGRRLLQASVVAGMGAIADAEGTTFRTWTPFATAVSVAGSFSSWSPVPMVSEGGGYWSIYVRDVGHGDEYKYVLNSFGQQLWKRDPYSRWVTNSVGNSKVLDFSQFTWDAVGYSTPPWHETVIYQMHIGTFNDTPGGLPGNFDTAINRLDYLQDLGINAVKLLPVKEFAGDFSWGYNPSDPYAVESVYGGPMGLNRFINEAHKRGIAVMLDVVHNHYGPSDLDLWRYDGWSQNGYGGIFFYNDARAVTPWGDTRPDFGRGEVRQYIRDNIMMWTEQYRADGLRWDSTLNIRQTNWGDNPDGWSLMQWVHNDLKSSQPWKMSIAEDLQGNDWITRATGAGGAGFDSQWTPSFVHPLRTVMTTPWDNDRNMGDVASAITQNYNGSWLQRVIYTESHDEVANGRSRVPSEIDPGNPGSWYARKRSTLGAILTMTSPGVPMIFQGQEILEDGWFQDTVPVDWTKETTYAGIRQMYKDLIRMRRNGDGNTRGLTGPNVNVFHVNHGAKVVAFHRWDQGGAGDDVVVLANFSNTSFADYRIGMPRTGLWNVIFNSDWNGYSPDFSNQFVADAWTGAPAMHGFGQSAGFRLPAYSAVVLVQNP